MGLSLGAAMAILVGVMAFMFLIGMPVFLVLAGTGILGIFLYFGETSNFYQFPYIFYQKSNTFVYVSIALFMYMAIALNYGGSGKRIYDVAAKWLGHLPGGLSIATIVACAIFGALSGTAIATTATIGTIAYPQMSKRGYSKNVILGCIATGGALGMLIPPSVPLIIYGALTEESIGALFIGGIIPGVILAILYSLLLFFQAKRAIGKGNVSKEGTPVVWKEPSATWRQRWGSLGSGFWALAIIALMIGGLYIGWFTPSEAGAVGVVLALILGMLVYRELKPKQLMPTLLEGVKSATFIYVLILAASVLNYALAIWKVPLIAADFVGNSGFSPWLIILLINIIFLILGCFMDAISMMLITVPILYPIIIACGFNGIWFGVMIIVNACLAVNTPPVGLDLYVVMGLAKGEATFADVVRGVIPFYTITALGLVLVCVFPQLATWLPSLGHVIG